MYPTADQAYEHDYHYITLAPEDSSSDYPSKSIRTLGPLFRGIIAFIISYLAFIFFSDSSIPNSLGKLEKSRIETYLNQITELSIQLDRQVIQASSHKEQTFPMLISRSVQDLEPPSLASIDLICVFDISPNQNLRESHFELTHHVKNFFTKVFSLMNDQDRLSIVLLDGLSDDKPILGLLPFANTTRENQKEILTSLSSLAENFSRENNPKIMAPVNILNQRNGINQATGIFLFTEEDDENFSKQAYKNRLGLQYVRTIARSVMKRSSYYHTEMIESFENGIKALRNYVAETILFIKPEESQFLKGIEIIDTYYVTPSYVEYNLQWWHNSDGGLYTLSSWLELGLQESFLFDLKIPKISHDLPESPMEVKIASCQQVYILLDGTRVVRNADLTVKIVREGEEFVSPFFAALSKNDFCSEFLSQFSIFWSRKKRFQVNIFCLILCFEFHPKSRLFHHKGQDYH